MTNAVPHTFLDIFTAGPSENDDVFVKNVVIPIIQRDYAQGRENDDVARVRARFLDALHSALVEDHPITLDFVYGEIDGKGDLIPLDGQQRLTTLFLLHWYICKHEEVDSSKCGFLTKFSYETRYSAREFCSSLADYFPDFGKARLADDIIDQSWFPMDWINDPTISSMLVMIDAIHAKFSNDFGLWDKLENGAITFYFLSLKEMGLIDELYIKMNSRGKPLTQFEHFKAELEGAIKLVDRGLAERISKKIDIAWTDMLWPYKGDNQIIDDKFIRYFHFICDIINYNNESDLIDDPFRMVQQMFAPCNDAARDNILYVETMFDCWCGFNINEFFDKYLAVKEHDPVKSMVGKMTNLFLDCCNVYGEMQSGRIRRFPIGRTILLYAFILYLQNKETVSEDDFIRRLRVVNNLVRASEFELRDDRMKTLLTQTSDIIVHGQIELTDKSFNVNQVKEEMVKSAYLNEHPDKENQFREAEDHHLLNGAIRVLGVDNIQLFPRFKQLFDCDWDLVDRALLATGDYSRYIIWRHQIGSSKIGSVWRDMFNTSEVDMARTKTVLNSLLCKIDVVDNEHLTAVVEDYLNGSPALDWRYYFVKYESMRPGCYGMYRWPHEDKDVKKSRNIIMMNTEKSTNGRNYNIFLKTVYDALHGEFPDLYLGTYAFQHDGDKLIIGSDKAISCDENTFTIYNVLDDKTYESREIIDIPQDESRVCDAQDRIEIAIEIVRKLHS